LGGRRKNQCQIRWEGKRTKRTVSLNSLKETLFRTVPPWRRFKKRPATVGCKDEKKKPSGDKNRLAERKEGDLMNTREAKKRAKKKRGKTALRHRKKEKFGPEGGKSQVAGVLLQKHSEPAPQERTHRPKD